MAFYFASWWMEVYFLIFIGIFSYYLYFKMVASNYWKNRNIPSAKPVFLLGNIWKAGILENTDMLLLDLYKEHKKHKMVGLWGFTTPFLLLTDPEIIKRILVRDFSQFRDHGFEFNSEREPLTGHLFNLKGAKWRNLRVKLTPTFTSGKMKMMFPAVLECGQELQEYLKKVAQSQQEVEVKEILARYTTDVIGSCAFGIQTNSLKNSESEFRKYGKKAFEPTIQTMIIGLILNISPALFELLKLRFFRKDVSDFFINTVRDTMEYRETKKVMRKDFLELLIQLKNKGKLDNVDEAVPTIPGEEEDPMESEVKDMKFTFNDAAAQAFVFFVAGFETSSSLMTFALYELAMNTEIQEKLQREIDESLSKSDGKLTYEGLMGMEYLDCVVQETLRKHPPVGALFRECNKDYYIPEMNVTIKKKEILFIPTLGIHRDPEIYPNPDKFDPDRFSPEEKAKKDHFTFLPFGEGPRMCIGNRFALLQSKVGLASVLSQFNVLACSRTPCPLQYNPLSIILSAKGGMYLKFTART